MTPHFRITSSHHLRSHLNRGILDVALLRLRFPSIAASKYGANLSAKNCGLISSRVLYLAAPSDKESPQ